MSRFTDREEMFEQSVPGDFMIRESETETVIWIHMPTGDFVRLPIAEKQSDGVWAWDGNYDAPTLTPSIGLRVPSGEREFRWHGWMREGKLVSV